MGVVRFRDRLRIWLIQSPTAVHFVAGLIAFISVLIVLLTIGAE